MMNRHFRRSAVGIALFSLASLGSAAFAATTTSYVYDAHGRLVKVDTTSGRYSSTTTNYSFDAVDNRTRVTSTRKYPRVIVVPLNGLSLIAIK